MTGWAGVLPGFTRPTYTPGAMEPDTRITAWARITSPIGALVATATPAGIARLVEASDTTDLGEHDRPRGRAAAWLDLLERELACYFSGRQQIFTVPVDWSGSTGERLRVLQTLHASVGFGQTITYQQLAERVGNPRAARFIGNAMAGNPVLILVPCHRVVASGGTLGGYRLGLPAKERLLALEGVTLQGPR